MVSSCPELWGGSEELWWAASVRLLDAGHRIDVLKLVVGDHPRLAELTARGCLVHDAQRLSSRRTWTAAGALPAGRYRLNAHRRLALTAVGPLLRRRPNLAVISQGQNFDGLLFAHVCRALRVPYVVVAQKASELYWPPDEARARHRVAYEGARACAFVAEHNRRVTEDQIGTELPRAIVVRNPVRVGADGPLPWPAADDMLRLACVGRLCAPEKGQDVLLRALGRDRWRERAVTVDLYGEGSNEAGLRSLAGRLGLGHQVRFCGHVGDVARIWREHHALVLPSHTEGMPLSLVEAMMCGRPGLVTDVGGNAEIVDDGRTGFLSATGTRALGEALERLWVARSRLREMGAAAALAIRRLVPADPVAPFVDLLLAAADDPG